uniref:Uncharacterized protein n=1 Tax=Molossus molossus TaxID=27622 RepID=A0A7J8J0A8_MOLMO|nr:hypothetical protein HJG59_010305 [Molossus molossus]
MSYRLSVPSEAQWPLGRARFGSHPFCARTPTAQLCLQPPRCTSLTRPRADAVGVKPVSQRKPVEPPTPFRRPRAAGVLSLPFQFLCATRTVGLFSASPQDCWCLFQSIPATWSHLSASSLCFTSDHSRAPQFSPLLLIKIKQSIFFPSITPNSLCNSIMIATLASASRGRWQGRHVAKIKGIVYRGTLCTQR